MREEYVRRLQIAVNDVAVVGVVDGTGERLNQFGGGARRERELLQLLGKRAAIRQFERQIGQAVRLADLEDLHDVRMLEACDRLGFGLEAGDFAGRGDAAGTEHLEGDVPVEAAVPGLVDHAHAALPQPMQHFVLGKIGTEPTRKQLDLGQRFHVDLSRLRENFIALDGAVNFELQFEVGSHVREASGVLVFGRVFAEFLAEDDLVVDQVELRFGAFFQGRSFEQFHDVGAAAGQPRFALLVEYRIEDRVREISHRPLHRVPCRP